MESSLEMEPDLSQFQWDAVTLRMTAFPKPSTEVTRIDWWQSVAGELPEQQILNPRSGEFAEHGKQGVGRLELNVNPVSVTWIHKVDELQPENRTATLGEFQNSCEKFCELMNRWFHLESVPNLVRVAFGANMIQKVQNQQAGMELLAGYIPSVTVDPANSSDFLYQINRRRTSKLDKEGLEINRVMKWSVTQHQLFLLNPATSGNTAPAPPESFVRLEIDINTMQEYEGEFLRVSLPETFAELVELGKEITKRGDVK